MNREAHLLLGRLAMVAGSPDWPQDVKTDAIDTIANVLHVVAAASPDSPHTTMSEVVSMAKRHVQDELLNAEEGDQA